jgi:hypothetical protein
MIGTAPGPALASSGSSAWAQPELYGPIMPTTRLLAAIVRAFLRQVVVVHEPVCALESSHSWYPTAKRPAR